MLPNRKPTHVSYLPLRVSRGEAELEALCGRMVPHLPRVIDNQLPTCPQCAGLLIRSILAMFPRGLIVPDPTFTFAPPDVVAELASVEHVHAS